MSQFAALIKPRPCAEGKGGGEGAGARHNARGGESSASHESEEQGGDRRGAREGLKEKACRRKQEKQSNTHEQSTRTARVETVVQTLQGQEAKICGDTGRSSACGVRMMVRACLTRW